MKKKWGEPRSRQDVEAQIPESYLAKDPETQERRKLSFLLQESAFSEHIPIFCIIDIDLLPAEEKDMVLSLTPPSSSGRPSPSHSSSPSRLLPATAATASRRAPNLSPWAT